MLIQFWKDYKIYDYIKNLSWAWKDVIKECINGKKEKTSRGSLMTLKNLALMRRLQKPTRLCLRLQTILTWLWMGMALSSS